jgi:hypothetical protein
MTARGLFTTTTPGRRKYLGARDRVCSLSRRAMIPAPRVRSHVAGSLGIAAVTEWMTASLRVIRDSLFDVRQRRAAASEMQTTQRRPRVYPPARSALRRSTPTPRTDLRAGRCAGSCSRNMSSLSINRVTTPHSRCCNTRLSWRTECRHTKLSHASDLLRTPGLRRRSRQTGDAQDWFRPCFVSRRLRSVCMRGSGA